MAGANQLVVLTGIVNGAGQMRAFLRVSDVIVFTGAHQQTLLLRIRITEQPTPPTGISSACAIVTRGYDSSRRNQERTSIQTLPTNMPRLVRVRNFISWRRLTNRSRSSNTENSSRHRDPLSLGVGVLSPSLAKMPLPHVIDHVNGYSVRSRRHHHVYARFHPLVAEHEYVFRLFAARQFRPASRS